MRLSTSTDGAALNVHGRAVPVLLYAGGTTGLVLLARAGRTRAFCAWLGERAESDGLSALAFAEDTTVERRSRCRGGFAASRAPRRRTDGGSGRRAGFRGGAARGGKERLRGVVLIDPVVELDALEPLLAEVPVAKLVLVLGADEAAQETAAAVYRYAIGPWPSAIFPAGHRRTRRPR